MAKEIFEQDVETPAPEAPPPVADEQIRDIREVDGSGDLPSPEVPQATETPAEEQPEIVSLRDAAQELGYEVSESDDDAAVLQTLVNQARQASAHQQQVEHYQKLLAAQQFQQQQPQQAQPEVPAEQDPLWNPPEIDPIWLTQVTKDDQGNFIPTAGGTQETVNKVLAYANYRQSQQDKFWSNPFEYMRPMMEQIARDQVSSGIQSNQDTMTAQQLVDQNADWIYDGDPRDRKFTPDGQLFYDAAQQLPHATPQEQFDFAMAKVNTVRAQRELAEAQNKLKATEAHEQKKREALGNTTPKPNSSGTLQDVEQNPGLSLYERMAANFKNAGIDLNSQIDYETTGAS